MSFVKFSYFKESLVELAWPTRCALCDTPGTLLCAACLATLDYVDTWDACPVCGTPHSRLQCSTCYELHASPDIHFSSFPDKCLSCVTLDDLSGRLISLYKDHNEQRLDSVFASIICSYVSPFALHNVQGVTFIPTSDNNLRTRGFDHGRLIAHKVSETLHLPLVDIFLPPSSKDQRALSRAERLDNMRHSLQIRRGCTLPHSLLLVDDVYTTGATSIAASCALKAFGVEKVYVATFARAQRLLETPSRKDLKSFAHNYL